MIPLPTEQQVIEAFRQTGICPSGSIFSGWTGSGKHCGCALAVYAQTLGHTISTQNEAVELFGRPARQFLLGWDYPDRLYDVDQDATFGVFYKNPIGERGARCWWACVQAGLVPNMSEIRNSDIRYAPEWWQGTSGRAT